MLPGALMEWTGAGERTVKNWLAGTSGQRGAHLVKLIRNSEYVLQVLLVLGSENESLPPKGFSMCDKLAEAADQLDAWLAEDADPKLDPSPSS